MENGLELRIVLLRHGNDRAGFGEGQNGRIQIEDAAKKMKSEFTDIKNAIIYSSPLDRAVMSSNILKKTLFPEIVSDEVIKSDYLCFDGSLKNHIKNLAEEIATKGTNGELLIFVSHQPDIERFTDKCGNYARLKNGEYVVVSYKLPPTQ